MKKCKFCFYKHTPAVVCRGFYLYVDQIRDYFNSEFKYSPITWNKKKYKKALKKAL